MRLIITQNRFVYRIAGPLPTHADRYLCRFQLNDSPVMISPYWVTTCEKGVGAPSIADLSDAEPLPEYTETQVVMEVEAALQHGEGGSIEFEETTLPEEEGVVLEETRALTKAEEKAEHMYQEPAAPDTSSRQTANLERKKEFALWRNSVRNQLDEIRQEVTELLGR